MERRSSFVTTHQHVIGWAKNLHKFKSPYQCNSSRWNKMDFTTTFLEFLGIKIRSQFSCIDMWFEWTLCNFSDPPCKCYSVVPRSWTRITESIVPGWRCQQASEWTLRTCCESPCTTTRYTSSHSWLHSYKPTQTDKCGCFSGFITEKHILKSCTAVFKATDAWNVDFIWTQYQCV